MASTQGQDVVLCQLCPSPVEHHCNLCHVDLCSPCTLKHLADKTNRHEIVEFINRKEGPVLPECDRHKKNRCEMYCKDCCKPTCVLCVTTEHKKHDFTDIGKIIEKSKQQIVADLTELENVIIPKYRNVTVSVPSAEFDKVLTAIQNQEDKLCKVVRDTSRKMRDEVIKHKNSSEWKNKEMQSLAAKTEKELNHITQNTKQLLTASDAVTVMSYKSKNEKFRDGMKVDISNFFHPNFLPGLVKEDQIVDMFGRLQMQGGIVSDKQLSVVELMETPFSFKEIQSPYGNKSKLWRIMCDGTGKIWVSGNDGTINQIEQNGSVLKSHTASKNVNALSLDVKKDLVFTIWWPNTKVYKYSDRVESVFDFSNWCPRGLCHTVNDNILVSMRSLDEKRSRVVRYSGSTEIQVIENDNQGKPLFSVCVKNVLLLTENGNGDICVADHYKGAVVVMNSAGILRFNYIGNINAKAKNKPFKPVDIVHDEKLHILIKDISNNIVHIIDCDGNFSRYIEYPCTGGISVDTERNLVVGEDKTGIIRLIKYLK